MQQDEIKPHSFVCQFRVDIYLLLYNIYTLSCFIIPLQAWPDDNVYFPDYWSPSAQAWWYQECLDHHKTIAYDGLWLVSVTGA